MYCVVITHMFGGLEKVIYICVNVTQIWKGTTYIIIRIQQSQQIA
jgi:hypothetical protein